MDPYLESPTHWSDFHSRFVNALSETISDRLPQNYVARIDEHVMAVTPMLRDEADSPTYLPDVSVLRGGGRSAGSDASSGNVAMLEESPPVTLQNVNFVEQYVENYLKVVRLPDMEVVAVVELFSPTNKYGDGRDVYMEKRRELLRQPVHIVEIDLLRAGVGVQLSDTLPPGHYHAFVSRADHRPQCQVYSWSVRQRLPMIPVPLRAPDADVPLDVSGAFALAYARGRYQRLIRYDAPPPSPRFSVADAEWVSQIARTAVPAT
jgi:hypothetical protein